MDSKQMRTSREEVEMVERVDKVDATEIVNLSRIDTVEGSNFHWTFGKILGIVVRFGQQQQASFLPIH